MTRSGMSIRYKILVGLLVVVSTVVGAITFTMAGLFHVDKKLYISDLASAMALHTAHEADVVATTYRDRLETFAAVADAPDVPADSKTMLLRQVLGSFDGLVAIRLRESGKDVLTLFDEPALAQAGLRREQFASVFDQPAENASPAIDGGVRIYRADTPAELPACTASLLHKRDDGRPPLEVTAIVRLNDLQRIAMGSEAFGIFLLDARGRLLAARDPRPAAHKAHVAIIPELDPMSAVVVREFNSENEVKIGGFAHGRRGGLWAIAELPKSAAFVASRLLLQRLLMVAFILLAMTAIVATVWARKLTRPIVGLANAANEVGRGRFDVSVKVESRDEIGALASSFNHMTTELDTRDKALKTAQAALIQSEKMAAFGQLGAGIAHEVKNPLAGIQGIVQLALRQADAQHPLHEPLAIIEKEAKRCRTIIDNLLKFARQEKAPRQPTDVAAVVGDAVAVMNHSLALHGVTLEKDIEPSLPQVMASPNQIQQVLMNLILNADQAFEGKAGTVRVEASRSDEGGVAIRVRDDGPGIPDDIVDRIFEPFFTTKAPGEGTGLGLSVTFGIIKDHGGKVTVETASGRGTTFVITLPPMPPGAGADFEAAAGAWSTIDGASVVTPPDARERAA